MQHIYKKRTIRELSKTVFTFSHYPIIQCCRKYLTQFIVLALVENIIQLTVLIYFLPLPNHPFFKKIIYLTPWSGYQSSLCQQLIDKYFFKKKLHSTIVIWKDLNWDFVCKWDSYKTKDLYKEMFCVKMFASQKRLVESGLSVFTLKEQ